MHPLVKLVLIVILVVMAVVAIKNGTGGAHVTTKPIFDAANFSAPLVGTALSIAVLSFLGFDGIATLSEESKGGHRSAGIAMIGGLFLVAFFFISQTWLAGMLIPNTTSFPEDQAGNAFFDIVGKISNNGWQIAFLAMNALAVGIALVIIYGVVNQAPEMQQRLDEAALELADTALNTGQQELGEEFTKALWDYLDMLVSE